MITKNIGLYLEFKGVSISAAEKKIGVSNGTLSKPIKTNKNIKTDTLEKFLIAFNDVDLNWLVENKESEKDRIITFPHHGSIKDTPTEYNLKTDISISDQKVPLYDIEAMASIVPLFNNTEEITPIDHISIPNLPKCDGAVHVTGDSMYPLLKSGDIVMYKEVPDIKNDIFWGQMYLLSIAVNGDDFVMVKYVQKSDKGEDWVKLVSQNQHHQDKDIQVKKIRALALIKASIRINTMN